jgi:DNA-binding transcriptional MerR regulator
MAKLVQILLMKQLGFTLSEIKMRLTSLDTTSDVVEVLSEHAMEIRRKLEALSESLDEIEALKSEIAVMQSVDFEKFALILLNLQMKNKLYWIIKDFDDSILKKLGEIMSMDKAKIIIEKTNSMFDEVEKLQKKKISPESEIGQEFAKKYWDATIEMTGGNMELIIEMNNLFKNHMEKYKNSNNHQAENTMATLNFIQTALEVYFNRVGCFTEEAAILHREGVAPESEKGQVFAKKYWDTMMEVSGGDLEFLQSMSEHVSKSHSSGDNPESSEFMVAHDYIKLVLETYFINQNDKNKGEKT